MLVRKSKYENEVSLKEEALKLADQLVLDKKFYEAQLLETREYGKRMAASRSAYKEQSEYLERLVTAYRVALPEVDRMKIQSEHTISNMAKEVEESHKDTAYAVAEMRRIKAIHAGRHRVGSLAKVEPSRITARIRGIEPTLRVEEGENQWLIYADRDLAESEMRAIESELGMKMDRT